MKKQMMTALAVSAMMTLAMPFASFAAARSCQTGFRPENNCGYTGTNAVSVIQMQGGCVISNRNAIDLYTLLGKGYPNRAAGNNWFVRHIYEKTGFFTPPYETTASLKKRLKKRYATVTLGTVKSMAWFACRKGLR